MIEYAARSVTGPVRKHNEDRFVADPELGLFVVCDGMGGHLAGQDAAQIACDTVLEIITAAAPFADEPTSSDTTMDYAALRLVVESAIQTAHDRIFETARLDPTKAGMGTTCTLLVIPDSGPAVMGHVGDSRLYALSSGTITQISEDHSFVNELVKSGSITEEEAQEHPRANIILRALGASNPPEVDTLAFTPAAGDTFLICSDGLTRYFVNREDLREGLEGKDLDAGADWLIERAVTGGGRDNITTVLIRTPDDA